MNHGLSLFMALDEHGAYKRVFGPDVVSSCVCEFRVQGVKDAIPVYHFCARCGGWKYAYCYVVDWQHPVDIISSETVTCQ